MKAGRNWATLTTSEAVNKVPPVRLLRPDCDAVRQYLVNDTERLAVHAAAPYGTLTAEAWTAAADFGLLKRVEHGADFSAYLIPDDTLSLRALTLGTGRRRTELLHTAYRRVGRAIAAAHELAAPLLQVDDFAFDRQHGQVLVVPPVAFGEGDFSPAEREAAFCGSMADAFSGATFPDKLDSLIQEVRVGISYDGRAS